MARRRSHFVKRAVDPVTDFELGLEGLEMDVARPVLDRLVENEIDEANDRSGAGLGFDIGPDRFVAIEGHELARFAELLQDVLHAGGVFAVVFAEPFLDLQAGRENDLDVATQGKTEILDRLGIERIDERDSD